MERAWDALPSLALVNIFQRISVKDRTHHVPLVCSSWAHASRDPHCWISMVPDSDLDFAFIKDSKPYSQVSVDVYGCRDTNKHCLGLTRLQTLIQHAGGGGGITSLFLFPFRTGSPNDDALLRLIAQCCPNLKYLSLYKTSYATKEAILEVIRSCKKLELVDFADSPHFSPLVLEEMGKCCPNIRGIRRNGSIEQSAISVLATSFRGRLKLLNLSDSPILQQDLVTLVSVCNGLHYLDVRGCRTFKSDLSIIQRASAQIVEFFYDRDLGGYWGRAYDSQDDDSSEDWSDNDDVTVNHFSDDNDDHILDEDEDVTDDDVSHDDDDDQIVDEDEDGDGDVTDYTDQIADDNDEVEMEEEKEEEEEEEGEDNTDDPVNGSEVSCDDDDDVNNDGYSDSLGDDGFEDNDSFDDDRGDDYDYDDDDYDDDSDY